MLSWINKQKIQEQLAQKTPQYTITSANLDVVESPAPPAIAMPDAASIVFVVPPDAKKSRERLLALRNTIASKGGISLSGEELDREVDRIRGR